MSAIHWDSIRTRKQSSVAILWIIIFGKNVIFKIVKIKISAIRIGFEYKRSCFNIFNALFNFNSFWLLSIIIQ